MCVGKGKRRWFVASCPVLAETEQELSPGSLGLCHQALGEAEGLDQGSHNRVGDQLHSGGARAAPHPEPPLRYLPRSVPEQRDCPPWKQPRENGERLMSTESSVSVQPSSSHC